MEKGKAIILVMVMALIAGLLLGVGCSPNDQSTNNVPNSPEPTMMVLGVVMGYAENHILWDVDKDLNVYVTRLRNPITIAGSSFPQNAQVDFYLDLTYPDEILLGNATTNAVGAFYGILPIKDYVLTPDPALDTKWECGPPLCDEPATFEWRACQLKAVVDGEVIATYPIVAHAEW